LFIVFMRSKASGGIPMNHLFRSLILCVLVATGLSGCAPAPAPAPTPTAAPTAEPTLPFGDSERTLTVDAVERSYLLHIPPNVPAGQPLPVVLVFHGFSGTGGSMLVATGFNSLSDTFGFLAVYPNGLGPAGATSWNAGGCCGYSDQNQIDEAAFVRAILADLGALATIDPKRIYATGFSNGAMLSYRLGCEMSETLAAVAPVAGVLLNNPCSPPQPVSVLHIHGMADLSVPYTGNTTPAAPGIFESVQQSIATFVGLDGCPPNPAVEQNGAVTHTIYGPCKNGTAVELYGLQGIGHTWPPASILPASQIIWNFFVAHPKP
jgi:polyhydroxybutyrate depolymerase